jgi:O-antigen/teichoic acid export membrane protein
MIKEVLRDTLIYLPARVIPALVGVLAILILTRLLSPEQYGQYLLATTTLSLISGFFVSWLVSVTIRFHVVYGVRSLYRMCRPLLLWIAVSACAVWTAAVYVYAFPQDKQLLLFVGILWLVTNAGFEYFAGWLRARNFAKVFSLAVSWKSLAGLGISVALLLSGLRSGETIIFGGAAAMLGALLFLPRLALRAPHEQDVLQSADGALPTILQYGIPVALSNFVTVALSLADRYFIGAQLGSEPVAVYGASYDLAEKTIFFANSMLLLSSSVIGFRIYEQEGEAKAALFLSQLMRLYLLVAPPLVMCLAVFSPFLITALLPAAYQEGWYILPIVAFAGLFVGILHRYSLLLSFHRRTDTIMWCSVAALLVKLVSCFLLIPRMGLLGAAISTPIAYASWLIFVRLAALKYLGPSFPWTTFIRVCAALLLAAASMHRLLDHIEASGILILSVVFTAGLIVYVGALYLFQEITRSDVKVTTDLLRKKFKRARG